MEPEREIPDIIISKINGLIDSLLPYGAGPMNERRLRLALEQVARAAYNQGEHDALFHLLTVEQAAERLGISRRRMNAIITVRNRQFATGMRFGNSWLIHERELESLRPGPEGWPKGRPRKTS